MPLGMQASIFGAYPPIARIKWELRQEEDPDSGVKMRGWRKWAVD